MASKARLFGDDSTLPAILSTDDPREHKRFGRQVRHFDNDTWLNERENIAFRGNLAKFSQNESLRLALLHTGERRLAEASPYENIWGIGLRASDPRASSPHTWRGSNLLGQTVEHVRTIYFHVCTDGTVFGLGSASSVSCVCVCVRVWRSACAVRALYHSP